MGSSLGSITSRCLGNEPALLLQSGGRLFPGNNRESGGNRAKLLHPVHPANFRAAHPQQTRLALKDSMCSSPLTHQKKKKGNHKLVNFLNLVAIFNTTIMTLSLHN